MPPDTLTVAYRATPTGPRPVLDLYVANPFGKETKLYAVATPHRQRTAIAREWAEAIELSPGAPVELQILQPDRVHNAAMNGHGSPGAPWGPVVHVVPDIDPPLDEPADLERARSGTELLLARPMKLGHDFLAHVRLTLDGPTERILLAA